MVQVPSDSRDIDKDYLIDQAVIGDAKLVLRQLIDEITRRLGGARNGDDVQAESREMKAAPHREWQPRLEANETPINPYRVIWALNNTLDRQRAIITHDSGNPRDQTLTTYEATVPRSYLGWGKSTQLGTGLGMALGAKLAQPDKMVVNTMGDLAFGTVGR